MDLRWIAVAIIGCVALALSIAVVLFTPMTAQRRRLRPLANVGRLTELPEYVRAVRRRTLSMLLVLALLVVAFAAAVIAGARPTGLPTAAGESTATEPEDIMLCLGGPPTDPVAAATLRYFAARAQTFGTQRIGLTSSNRRVVPLTRDYQYVAGEFNELATPAGGADLVSPTSYVDYAGDVADQLALCMTGFPSFEQKTAQRRSVIYVGPGTLRTPGDRRAVLFTFERAAAMARTAGVQVNAVVTGAVPDALAALARETGGSSFTASPDVATQLAAIGDRPPAPVGVDAETAAVPTETPDLPILVALLATAALSAAPLVMRR